MHDHSFFKAGSEYGAELVLWDVEPCVWPAGPGFSLHLQAQHTPGEQLEETERDTHNKRKSQILYKPSNTGKCLYCQPANEK